MKKKILYFEAPDGISGDMTLGALIDLGADVSAIKRELDTFVPGEYELIPRPFERNGIHGVSLDVIVPGEMHDHGHSRQKEPSPMSHDHGHSRQKEPSPMSGHRRYGEIAEMISGSGIPGEAKGYALAIFDVIAEAEAAVHRVPKAEVVFHEVGAMDSIIDIVGTAIAVSLLGADAFYTAALHDGSGVIECRHGVIPVPVPAVMEMAKGRDVPVVIESDVDTEMITPTGFGIIAGLGAKFEPRLGIVPEKTGYGFGKRDTGRLGALRVTLGELYEEEAI